MARIKGKDATLYVGTSSPPLVKVGGAKDFNFDGSVTTADGTTNDSGDFEEHELIRKTGDLTFKALTDPVDPGQVLVRNAVKTMTKLFCEYREQGDGTGKPGERFSASFSFKRSSGINELGSADWTCKPSGIRTDVTQ